MDRSAAADDPYLRRWRALSVPLAAGFVSVLDSGIVSVAVPSIQRGAAIGAAAVAGAFYMTLGVTDVVTAVSVGIGGATLGVAVALAIAAVDSLRAPPPVTRGGSVTNK